jgi:HEAT repeat protein
LNAQVPTRQFVSGDQGLQQKALQQLSRLSDRQKLDYIPDLVRLMRDSKDVQQANRSVLAFVKIGPLATPSLLSLLADSSPDTRGRAAQALAMIRPTTQMVIDRLHALLDDRNEWVRQRVAECLLSMSVADERAEQIEKDLWKQGVRVEIPPSEQPKDISEAIEWLSDYDVPRSDRFIFGREYLTTVGVPAVQPLLAAVETGGETTRAGALSVLFNMHVYRPDIEAAAIKGIEDDSIVVRDSASYILDFTVTEAAKDALLSEEVADIGRRRSGKPVRAR